MRISEELLQVLACPKCKGKVELTPQEDGLACFTCKLLYPIDEYDIPVMIVEEAKPL